MGLRQVRGSPFRTLNVVEIAAEYNFSSLNQGNMGVYAAPT